MPSYQLTSNPGISNLPIVEVVCPLRALIYNEYLLEVFQKASNISKDTK